MLELKGTSNYEDHHGGLWREKGAMTRRGINGGLGVLAFFDLTWLG